MEIKAKVYKWDLIKLKSFCTTRETEQGEKTAFRMGENNSKWNNWKIISKYTPTPTILKYNVHFMKYTLIEGWKTYNSNIKYSSLPVFVNKVLMEHNHVLPMDIIFDTNTELCIMVLPMDIIFGINTELCIMVTFKLFICHLVVNSCRLPRWLTDKELACKCRRHEALVRPLGWEDPLEEGMATHSNILAWRTHG